LDPELASNKKDLASDLGHHDKWLSRLQIQKADPSKTHPLSVQKDPAMKTPRRAMPDREDDRLGLFGFTVAFMARNAREPRKVSLVDHVAFGN